MLKKAHIYKLTKLTMFLGVIGLSGITTIMILGTRQFTNVVEGLGTVLGVQTNREKQARALRAKMIIEAYRLLVAVPNPIPNISMEGKLTNDPSRLATIKSLHDIGKIYRLAYAYKITNDVKYLAKTKELLLAWTSVYRASGNSINESHLQELFEGYRWVRPSLNYKETQLIDNWLRTIAEKELNIKYNDDRSTNNWNNHRLNIIGQIGYLIEDDEYVKYALDGFKSQVEDYLYVDGSSSDFTKRDALHYHSYGIYPLLNLAKIAARNGVDLYNYESPSGSSLRKSVQFLYPYFSGDKTHIEFINSTADWDRNYERELWVPKNDLYILELAYFFDDEALPLIQKIQNTQAEVPSFEAMIALEERSEINIINQSIPYKF